MVERLRDRHRLVLFTSFDALEFLQKEYAHDDEVQVREIPGLKFHYSDGKIDNTKTIREGLSLWSNLRKITRQLADAMRSDKPDLVVTDFEPCLPRAAHRCGVPVLSLDHQHFLIAYDLSSAPIRLQRWAWAMGWSVWMFGIKQTATVISAFYRPPLRPEWSHATQAGPLLRPAVRERQPSRAGHYLSYLRRATTDRELAELADLGVPLRVYGLGEREPLGGLTFHAIDEHSFLDDLTSCEGVIAAAGNQLLGESLYFGKPVFALPEHSHHEQCLNAHFLKELGGGDWAYLESFQKKEVLAFLDRQEEYRQTIAASGYSFDGTDEATAAIEAMLAD